MDERFSRKVLLVFIMAVLANVGCYQPPYQPSRSVQHPQNIRDLNNAAILSSSYGDYEDAVDYCTQALEQDPNNLTALETRATSLARLDRYDEALADAQRLVGLSPTNTDNLYNLGWIASFADRHDIGLDAYEKVFELDPYPPAQAYNGRAWANVMLGNLSTVLEDINTALASDPTNNNYIDTRAVYYYKVGELDKALEDINQSIELSPNTGEHYYHRAQIYIEQKKWVDAYDDLTYASRLDTHYSDVDELLEFTEQKVLEQFEEENSGN